MEKQPRITEFGSIRIKLASPDEILNWSYGEVVKPETINYRTQRPEKDGLFSERIFGPTKDYECYCGKYKKVRYKGVVCDKCGVEVTHSSVRRERMGHITLATPVAHIWFLRVVPSRVGLILDLPLPQLEKVVYYASYIIAEVDEGAKTRVLSEIEREFDRKYKGLKKLKANKLKIKQLEDLKTRAIYEVKSLTPKRILSEIEYLNLSQKYSSIFKAYTGSEVIRSMLEGLDLKKLEHVLEENIEKEKSVQIKRKIARRLKLVRSLIGAGIRPEWMFLTVLPVLPPDLRPMIQLDGGRYASSDLNDLYRRVINRNNRLKKLMSLNAPEIIIRNERRMLQQAVDALIDNSIHRAKGTGGAAMTVKRRALKSLADMLKGKQGRFRQNLLGKRVDYSARSVIVIGPELKLDECGLPKTMALEIFKPFVVSELIKREIVYNPKAANRLIQEGSSEIWAILEEVIENKYVLLNRAPTLHRLSVQAFKPLLIEGLAIQIPALVCAAFNADFDGDQMAVHLPLSAEAQNEAQNIMLASKNLLKPASGEPIVNPTNDIVLGCFWLTQVDEKLSVKKIKVFTTPEEALLFHDNDLINLREKIKVRIKDEFIETTAGRIIFNQSLPGTFAFVNKALDKKGLKEIVNQIISKYGFESAVKVVDGIKDLGFKYATISGISWGIDDLTVPTEKEALIKEGEREVLKIQEQYENGLLSDIERERMIIGVWEDIILEITDLVPKTLNPEGSVYSIVQSRARGTWLQVAQMCGIKGLVSNPAGQTIDLPVKSSYKEGFNILEYFISTHGARKGTVDTALKTASAGYLTRRLVVVMQDLIITALDCKTKEGLIIGRKDAESVNESFENKINNRILVKDVKAKGGKIIAASGSVITKEIAKKIETGNIDEVSVRSPIACKITFGVCQKCYGLDLSTNRLAEPGSAVGVIAAQAIGEPGTQLTMRTFHTGGVTRAIDITQGLPRVEELFEARTPRFKAVIAQEKGVVKEINEKGPFQSIKIKGKKIITYSIPRGISIFVKEKDKIEAGQQLSEGSLDLKESFSILGKDFVSRYILTEVKKIYNNAGELINDKHIELVIHQMLSRVRVKESGDSSFVMGDVITKQAFTEEIEKQKKAKKTPPKASQLIMGITKVALTTESFLSAAAFQETARVLVAASLDGREDKLKGLMENVIIGRLIPVGTGVSKEKDK